MKKPMTLRDTVLAAMKAGNMTQRQLGMRLGLPEAQAQPRVSSMVRADPERSDLEDHWNMAIQLLRVCEELGIDPVRQARPRLKLVRKR